MTDQIDTEKIRVIARNPIWGTQQIVILGKPRAYKIGDTICHDGTWWTVARTCAKTVYVPPGVGAADDVAYICEPADAPS